MMMMELLLDQRLFKARNKLFLMRTLLLFNLLLTLSGRSSAECEGHREGDKWFDGCRWCLCQGDIIKCTICQVQGLQLQPCKIIDEIWYDGGYQCKCRPDEIHCRIGRSFAALLSSNEMEWREELNCSAFGGQQCICGLDGVPSCSTQVIDRSKTNAKTIFLYPRFVASSGFQRVKVSKQKARRSLLNLLLENYIAKPTDSNYKSLQKFARGDNQEEDRTQEDNSIQRSTSSIITVTSNRCWQGSRWYGGGLRCYCDHITRSITCGDPIFIATKVDGIRLQAKPCLEGTSWEEETSCHSCTCLIDGVVYCNRSSLCPFPKLITPYHDNIEIDEETGEMTGGEVEVWDKWTPETDDDVDSADWMTRETTNAQSDTTTGTLTTTQKTSNTTRAYYNSTDKKNNGHSKEKSNASTLVTIRECLPGTMKMKQCQNCTCDMNGRFQCDNSTCKTSNRNATSPIFQTSRPDATSPISQTSRPDVTSPISQTYRPDVTSPVSQTSRPDVPSPVSQTSRPDVTSPVSQTSRPDVTSPVSQTSRPDVTSPISQTSRPDVTSPISQTSRPDVTSPISQTSRPDATSPVSQTSSADVTSPTLSTNHYYSRQFKTLRPYTVIPGNRDYAITFKPQDTSCGDYKLNEEYRVDCNVCVCTVVGPKCTAKNCVTQ